jgi:hypothetical protein
VNSIVVAVERPGLGVRRVAKVQPYRDGGWALIPAFQPVPHPGFLLMEIPTDYSRAGAFHVPRSSLLREYRSAHGVKLSVHGAGYVQFSRVGSEGVLSGVDPVSRQARAFGLQSRPTTDPPRSGPMFGISAWGLAGYPALATSRRDVVVVREDRQYLENPDLDLERSGVALEFWPLPRWALPHASRVGDLTILEGGRHAYYADQLVDFIALDTGYPLMILGLVATAYVVQRPASTGVWMSGPSDLGGNRALAAVSPPPHSDPVPSADYTDAFPALPPGRLLFSPTQWVPDRRLNRPWGRPRDGRAP